MDVAMSGQLSTISDRTQVFFLHLLSSLLWLSVAIMFILLSFSGQVRGEMEHDIQGEGIVNENAKLEVIDVQGGVTVDTGPMCFELRHGGILHSLYIGDKAPSKTGDKPLFKVLYFFRGAVAADDDLFMRIM